MDEIEIAFKNAVSKSLTGKVQGIDFTALLNQKKHENIELIVRCLDNVSDPFDFFESWAEKGNKTVDGFYLMLDMFCYLLIKNGSESANALTKYQHSKSPYIKHVLDVYNNDRTKAEVVKTFSGLKKEKSPQDDKSKPLDIKHSSILLSKPKAILKSKNFWELGGETVVLTKSVKRGNNNTITLTVSNGYGPIDSLKAYALVCVDNAQPVSLNLNPPAPWVNIPQVEDMILIDDGYYKSNGGQLLDNPCEELPWWRTFKLSYELAEQEHTIQLMVIDKTEFSESGEPLAVYNSAIISDWIIK